MNKLEDTVRSCCDSVHIASIYLTGWQIPPHFPMPAIPLACAILPDVVQIAEVIWFDDAIEPEFELIIEFH